MFMHPAPVVIVAGIAACNVWSGIVQACCKLHQTVWQRVRCDQQSACRTQQLGWSTGGLCMLAGCSAPKASLNLLCVLVAFIVIALPIAPKVQAVPTASCCARKHACSRGCHRRRLWPVICACICCTEQAQPSPQTLYGHKACSWPPLSGCWLCISLHGCMYSSARCACTTFKRMPMICAVTWQGYVCRMWKLHQCTEVPACTHLCTALG